MVAYPKSQLLNVNQIYMSAGVGVDCYPKSQKGTTGIRQTYTVILSSIGKRERHRTLFYRTTGIVEKAIKPKKTKNLVVQ